MVKGKKVGLIITLLVLAVALTSGGIIINDNNAQVNAQQNIEMSGISKVYKGIYANTAYYDFAINFSAPIGDNAANIEKAIATSAQYDNFATKLKINGKTLKEIAVFSESYAGWKPDNMLPVFGMHIVDGSLHIALCAINRLNHTAKDNYGANGSYLFNLDGSDYIETIAGGVFSSGKKLFYSNKWYATSTTSDWSNSADWTETAVAQTAIKCEINGISSVSDDNTNRKVYVYFKNEIDNNPYIMNCYEYWEGAPNYEADRYAIYTETLKKIKVNGVAVSDIYSRNNIVTIDSKNNYFVITLPKTINESFKCDGSDVITFDAGFTLPNGNTLENKVEYCYFGSPVSPADATKNQDAWARKEAAVAGEVRLSGMNFGAKQKNDDYIFTILATSADGSQAKLGVGNDKQLLPNFSSNIIVNGKSVAQQNEANANNVVVSLEGNKIILKVKPSVLKLKDNDTIMIKKELAFDGVTIAAAKTYTFYNTIGGYLTSVEASSEMSEIQINSVRGVKITEMENRMAIEFSQSASEQFFFHINALYNDFDWLKNEYPGYSEFYASNDDERVQRLIVNGVVSSLYDKIFIKEEGASDYVSLRELCGDAIVNEVLAHYGQDYITGANLNTLILSVKAINTNKAFSMKIAKGFVTASMCKVDKDYIYHYNPITQEMYPDESIIKPGNASVTGITKVVSSAGYSKFTVKFSKSASFYDIPNAINDDNILDYVKINGITARALMTSAKDFEGKNVKNAIKAHYDYQTSGSSFVVLYLEISEEIASEGKLNFDGKDVICFMKDFSTPNKNKLSKYYGGILGKDLTWKLKNGNSEIIYEEKKPDEKPDVKPVDPQPEDKGCKAKNAAALLFTIIGGLGMTLFVTRRR